MLHLLYVAIYPIASTSTSSAMPFIQRLPRRRPLVVQAAGGRQHQGRLAALVLEPRVRLAAASKHMIYIEIDM